MKKEKALPKLLRDEYTEQVFNRKVVRRVFLQQDRTFLASCFERTNTGNYRLRTNLDEKELKRATSLATQIHKNRGSLKKGRIIFLALLIGAVVGFNLLFKNQLLTRVGEQALQTAFEAKAEIRDLDLRLLSGSLSFSGVSVADRDRPFRNLFEIGTTGIEIDTIELLKGNVVTRRVTIENIQWNTERSDSGMIEGSATRPPAAATEPAAIAGISLPSLDPDDARAFLMQHYDSLKAPVVIDEARDTLNRLTSQIPLRLEDGTRQLSALTESVTTLGGIEVQQIDTLDSALATYRQIEGTTASLRRDTATIEQNLREVSAEAGSVTEIWAGLTSAVADDTGYLSDRITQVTSDPTGFVADIVAELMREVFSEVFRYVDRAKELAAIAGIGDSSDPPENYRSGGTNVVFPRARYPRFYLELGVISFGTEESQSFQQGAIRDLSTAPHLIARPTEFELRTLSGNREHRIAAQLNAHRNEGSLFEARYAGTELPISTSARMGTVNLQSLSGNAAISTDARFDREGILRGNAAISIRKPVLALTTGVAVVDRIVASAVQRADTIDTILEYTARDDRITSLSVKTSLDADIASGVRAYIDDQRTVFEARLRQEITQLVAAERTRLEPLEQQVLDIRGRAGQEIDRAISYRQTAERKLAEIDGRVAELRARAESRLQSEAEKTIDSIIDRVPTPSLPRLR